MGLLIIFGIGAGIGLAMSLARRVGQALAFVSVAIGIVGAMVGGILAPTLVGSPAFEPDNFHGSLALWACAGAIMFVAGLTAIDWLTGSRR
ncbi:hypothetical protein [Sphingomonas sp.]|uniref:hypothetical protein n=1 Tax=Sphingomonas sp. TaxID=28214 RepID=UPI0025FB873C|nr:hypothetical protein [Sphingomonas sp.]